METDELKRIWNTLAMNKLIDKKLAKDNILQIITKKGTGIISKMKRKFRFDYYTQLFAIIAIPLTILFAIYWHNQHPLARTASELSRAYVILSLMELLMIYSFSKSVRNLKFLDYSFNTGSIKESLLNVNSHFRAFFKKTYWVGVLSMLFILSFVLIDLFLKLGGVKQMNFSSTGSYIFESYFSIFVMILMIAIPFLVKLDFKRYAGAMRDIEKTIDELSEEED